MTDNHHPDDETARWHARLWLEGRLIVAAALVGFTVAFLAAGYAPAATIAGLIAAAATLSVIRDLANREDFR